jgi:hypothetical protein
MTMEGKVDFAGKKVQMTMDMGNLAESMGEGGEINADDLNMEMVMQDTTMYMSMPLLEKELGEKWVKIDLQKALEGSGIDLAGLQQQTSSMSPTEQLKLLKTMGDLEEVDDNHFKGTVDLRKLPGESGKKIAELGGSPTYPTEVWVNDDGYIERQKMEMTQKVEGQTIKSAVDVRYTDFGTAVDIDTPDPDDVRDMTDIAQQGIEEQGGG